MIIYNIPHLKANNIRHLGHIKAVLQASAEQSKKVVRPIARTMPKNLTISDSYVILTDFINIKSINIFRPKLRNVPHLLKSYVLVQY
jgi:hypothetical protein